MGGFGLIPRWKIARELDRLSQQLKSYLGLLWEPYVQFKYDRDRHNQLVVANGSRPLRSRVAVYLLYQPKGVLSSTIETCRILEGLGYATLIVSNAKIGSGDIERLREVAWRIIQRPNYGYDFGGYRDGILFLNESGIIPDSLIVMNDSIWFPLQTQDDLVSRMEVSGLDVCGTIVHHSFRKTFFRRRSTRVIESYFFMFSRTAVCSAAFKRFWKTYRLSSNKYNAVHRGERKVAEYMMAGGLTADGLFSRGGFLSKLAQCDDEFLRKTLKYAAYTDVAFERERDILLSDNTSGSSWRGNAMEHISRTTLKRNFHGSFVYATIQLMGLSLMKKSSGSFLKRSYGTLYGRMRENYLEAVASHDLPTPRPEVMAEISGRE